MTSKKLYKKGLTKPFFYDIINTEREGKPKSTPLKKGNKMIIIDNKKITKTPFEEIAIGEVFSDFLSENYFIRIKGFYDENDDFYNAVDLRNGELNLFEPTEDIEKVKAELHISNY